MYHRVGDLPENADATTTDLTVPTASFEEQMTFLDKQGYTSITPDQLYDWLSKGKAIPKKSVVITFDDGYQDAFDNAVPILSEHHFVGVFGIITGFVGTRDYADWQMIGTAKDKGMIIVSHSYNHFDFSKHSYADQEYSIAKSTVDITDNLGFTPAYFIYPYGTYNADTENILSVHGYVMAFTTAYGFAQKGENLLEIPRVRVHGKEILSRFEYDVAGIPLPVDQTADNQTSNTANPTLLQMPATADKGE
jgi:peptidoglycan/xylan/chitin deacetylase (PgdA/CDA1 family)